MSERRIDRNIPLVWDHVREIRELVVDELAHLPEDVRDAAAMTSSELLENAVKYGDTERPPGQATFTLVHSSNDLRIELSNPCRSDGALAKLRDHIERISATDDKESLYVERMTEILTADGDAASRLGLYRIAFEGSFDLELSTVGDVVTVIATRKAA